MIKQLVAGLCLLLAPSLAFSFPIAVSAIGAGLLGALALPAALLVGAVVIARKVGASSSTPYGHGNCSGVLRCVDARLRR